LAIANLGGINTALIQSVAKGFDGSLIPACKEKIKWGSIGGVIAILLGLYYFFQNNNQLGELFIVMGIFLPFIDAFSVYDSFLQGKKNFKQSSRYNIISQIFASIVIIATLFITKDITIILLAYFSSWSLIRFIFLKSVFKNKKNVLIDTNTIPYGKHLTYIGAISVIASQFDRMAIFNQIGAVEVAIYTITTSAPDQIKNFIKIISSLALPKFSENKIDYYKKSIWPKTIKLGLLTTIIIVIYIFLAKILFIFLFPKFLPYVIYSQVYVVSILISILVIPMYTLMQAQSMKKELYQFNIITAVSQIITIIIFCFFWGLWGIIFARIATRLIGLVFILFRVKKINLTATPR